MKASVRKGWLLSALAAALILAAIAAVSWLRLARDTGQAASVDIEALGAFGQVPDFTLTERSGRTVTRAVLLGKVWLVSFIYTECTETCPTQSQQMAALQRQFALEPDLRFVSITVDPAPLLKRFHARAKGRGNRIVKRNSHIVVTVGDGKSE